MSASPMTLILTAIHAQIPNQILEATFLKDNVFSSVDERIMAEVLRKRVLLDCNLVATKACQIPLRDEWVRRTEYANFDTFAAFLYSSTYMWIPPEARENRNIASVVRVMSGISQPGVPAIGTMTGWYAGGNTIGSMASAVVGSHTLRGAGWAPMVINEGNNFIRITGTYPNTFMAGLVLECTLEYDPEFTNADQNMIYALRDLCVCAVKAHIYHQLAIRIGESEIVAGMEIGVFKDIVNSYSNANEEYDHLLKKVRGAQVLDPNTVAEFMWLSL